MGGIEATELNAEEIEKISRIYHHQDSSVSDRFRKLCRLCLVAGDYHSISQLRFNNQTLAHILQICTSIQVEEVDLYPHTVCHNCLTQLINAYQFLSKCRKSDAILKVVVDNPIHETPIEIDDDEQGAENDIASDPLAIDFANEETVDTTPPISELKKSTAVESSEEQTTIDVDPLDVQLNCTDELRTGHRDCTKATEQTRRRKVEMKEAKVVIERLSLDFTNSLTRKNRPSARRTREARKKTEMQRITNVNIMKTTSTRLKQHQKVSNFATTAKQSKSKTRPITKHIERSIEESEEEEPDNQPTVGDLPLYSNSDNEKEYRQEIRKIDEIIIGTGNVKKRRKKTNDIPLPAKLDSGKKFVKKPKKNTKVNINERKDRNKKDGMKQRQKGRKFDHVKFAKDSEHGKVVNMIGSRSSAILENRTKHTTKTKSKAPKIHAIPSSAELLELLESETEEDTKTMSKFNGITEEVQEEPLNEMDEDTFIIETLSTEFDIVEAPEETIEQVTDKPKKRKRTRPAVNRMVKKEEGVDEMPMYECRRCPATFTVYQDYIDHVRNLNHRSKGRLEVCEICGKQTTTYRLKLHMRSHTKEQPYKCKLCPQRFSIAGNLYRHHKIHTGEKPHMCDICGKAFIQSTTLKEHRATHTKLRGGDFFFDPTAGSAHLLCSYCGRGFKRLRPYHCHLMRHKIEDNVKVELDNIAMTEGKVIDEIEKTHVCDKCSKAFASKLALRTHRLTHGEKNYLCSDCGKGFTSKAALRSHLKVHTGVKPYTCMACYKSFAHAASYESHVLIHTGFKPYRCMVCARSFTQSVHLKYHLLTHSGERPHKCNWCDKRFSLKGNLTVHMRTHTGETPYVCQVCGKGFYDSSSMKKHRKGHTEIATLKNEDDKLQSTVPLQSDEDDKQSILHLQSDEDDKLQLMLPLQSDEDNSVSQD